MSRGYSEQQERLREMYHQQPPSRIRRDECMQGHPFTDANSTYQVNRNRRRVVRRCRACRRKS